MKSNKVLLGLFAGVLALTGGSVRAQFYEIGPANIGGEVSSIVVDEQDASRTTVYAGAISGGLYVRTKKATVLENLYANVTNAPVENLKRDTSSWHYVPLRDAQGNELNTLPISAMVQGPDGTIYIGTGDDRYAFGSTMSKMSLKGRGVYRYNPETGVCKMIAYTNPAMNSLFGAVRAMDWFYHNDTLYFFVASNTGLYRWTISDANSESDWSLDAKCVQGVSVESLVVSRTMGTAYFSSARHMYRVGNVTASNNAVNAVDISSSNAVFGADKGIIRMAMAPSDNRYLYAMLVDSNGVFDGVYVTLNGQSWNRVSTESVTPMNYTSGLTSGTLAVDPWDARRVIIGGSDVWVGKGYSDGAYYMWTHSSYSEYMLNGGNYMEQVFNSSVFVHSGIYQIIPVWTGEVMMYYIATNGGVYSTKTNFNSYDNLNRGLNNVMINSVAVSPDGSVISGARDNACPYIESRMAHYGGSPVISWYDYGTMGNMNHSANVLFAGSGTKVAASAFYHIYPEDQTRRNIFVSTNGRLARSYTDYQDYTNATTWNIDSAFTTRFYAGGYGGFSLWEKVYDDASANPFKDSIKATLDMRGYFFRRQSDGTFEKEWIKQNANLKVKTGDKAIVLSKSNSDYPFDYYFSAADNGRSVADTFVVKNNVLSRGLAVAKTGNRQCVIFTWIPSDFSRVYTTEVQNLPLNANTKPEKEKMMKWVDIFPKNNPGDTLNPRDAVMSQDGRFAFISTYVAATHRSQLFRIKGFERVNYFRVSDSINADMSYQTSADRRLLTPELFNPNGSRWFSRPISSIAVDPRPGVDRVVLTFEDYSENGDNVVIINNATSDSWSMQPIPITGHTGIPAFTAMIEKTTGDIYVGTSDGVFIYNGTSWREYEHLKDLPVTSIVQQTFELPIRRALTHTGIDAKNHVFAKTKWPRAIYFGTYGRGIFMDTTYVIDSENEVCDSSDYNHVGIPTVESNGENSVSIYPNPVSGEAHVALSTIEAGNAVLRIYDLNGRCVVNRDLGYASEGEQVYTLNTEGMNKGMYLVNVIIGGYTAATKMIVR